MKNVEEGGRSNNAGRGRKMRVKDAGGEEQVEIYVKRRIKESEGICRERKEDVEGRKRWRRGRGQEIKEWMKEGGGGGGDAKRDKEGKEKTETGCDKVTRRWWSGKGEAFGGGGWEGDL